MKNSFFAYTLAYFVATMLIAVPWHMHWFHDEYVAMGAFTRIQPIMPLGISAVLIQALVFAYFYPVYLAHGPKGNPIVRSLQYSFTLGLLVYTTMVFATGAKFKIEPLGSFILLASTFQFLQYLLVGLAFGGITKFKSKDRK